MVVCNKFVKKYKNHVIANLIDVLIFFIPLLILYLHGRFLYTLNIYYEKINSIYPYLDDDDD